MTSIRPVGFTGGFAAQQDLLKRKPVESTRFGQKTATPSIETVVEQEMNQLKQIKGTVSRSVPRQEEPISRLVDLMIDRKQRCLNHQIGNKPIVVNGPSLGQIFYALENIGILQKRFVITGNYQSADGTQRLKSSREQFEDQQLLVSYLKNMNQEALDGKPRDLLVLYDDGKTNSPLRKQLNSAVLGGNLVLKDERGSTVDFVPLNGLEIILVSESEKPASDADVRFNA